MVHMDGKTFNINLEVSRRVTQRLASLVMKIFLKEVIGYAGVSIVEKEDRFDVDETFARLNNATPAVLEYTDHAV